MVCGRRRGSRGHRRCCLLQQYLRAAAKCNQGGARCRTRSAIRRRAGMRRLPREGDGGVARLRPRPRDAGRRCEVRARRFRRREVRARGHDLDVLHARRQVLRQHRRPRRQARRLRGQVHVRRLPAAAVPDRASRRAPAGARRSRGTARPKAAGRAALVPPVSGRRPLKPGDPLHWTGIDQNWNFQCAECHSTNLRKGFDARTGTFHTTWSEIDVSLRGLPRPGIESRGVGEEGDRRGAATRDKGLVVALDERKGVHVDARRGTGNARRSAPRTTAREIDTCAPLPRARGAHLRRLRAWQAAARHARRALLDDGLYWADGQMRDEVYNWGSFLQSRMHAQGVTCSDCHDPHSLQAARARQRACARSAIGRRSSTPARTRIMRPARRARVRRVPHADDDLHGASIRGTIIRCAFRARTSRSSSACRTRATTVTDKRTPQWAAAAVAAGGASAPVGYQRFAEALAAGTSARPARAACC